MCSVTVSNNARASPRVSWSISRQAGVMRPNKEWGAQRHLLRLQFKQKIAAFELRICLKVAAKAELQIVNRTRSRRCRLDVRGRRGVRCGGISGRGMGCIARLQLCHWHVRDSAFLTADMKNQMRILVFGHSMNLGDIVFNTPLPAIINQAYVVGWI